MDSGSDEFDSVSRPLGPIDAAVNADEPPAKRRRKRQASRIASAGLLAAWLVCNGSQSVETDAIEGVWAKGPSRDPRYDATVVAIVALVLYAWRFVKAREPVDDAISRDWQCQLLKSKRRQRILGCIEYSCNACYVFDAPFLIPQAQVDAEHVCCDQWSLSSDAFVSNGISATELLASNGVTSRITSFCVSPQLAESICKERCKIIHVQPLHCHMNARDVFWRRQPTPLEAKRLLKSADVDDVDGDDVGDDELRPQPDQVELLALPAGTPEFQMRKTLGGKLVPAFDACKSLRLMRFSRHIKDKNKLGVALEDAIDAICVDEATQDTLKADQAENPKKSSHKSQILKMDAVGMLLDQREMAQMYHHSKEELVSCHVFTDGSPVTGTELQGMVIQFCLLSGIVLTRVLPGVALHYGGLGLWDKIFAFLWALWLTLGSISIMRWVLDHTTTVTTDQGTEFGFVDAVDVLGAFFCRLKTKLPLDELSGLIASGSRLLRYAVKIPDWSHVFGNLMKHGAQGIEDWPKILSSLRSLCRFFRSSDWRSLIVSKVKADYPAAHEKLKTFTARLAKWRYQTVCDVLGQLVVLRFLCETFLTDIDEMFPAFQDKELLLEVQAACRWGVLWIFIATFFKFFAKPLEEARRWGLKCPCPECEELRRAGKTPKCSKSSRRLHQARAFIQNLVASFSEMGRNLTLADCEGSFWVFQQVQFAIRKVTTDIGFKFKFLGCFPWLIAEADSPEVCKMIIDQLNAADPERISPQAANYRDDLLESLEALTC